MMITLASPAWAQQADLSRLQQAATAGADVSVSMDEDRAPIRGRIRSVTESMIVLDVGGTQTTVTLDRVSRVDRDGDSLTNGILIGASILGGWCAFVCGQGAGRPFSYGVIVAGNAAIGGLIGAWFDAARDGTTKVYERSSKAVGLAFNRNGIAVTVGF